MGPREHALRAYRTGYDDAAAGRPVTACPYDVNGSPRERLASRLYVRGYVNARAAAGDTAPQDAASEAVDLELAASVSGASVPPESAS